MKVLVVGAGTMGHGIGELCALFGHEVVLVDVSEDVLEKAKQKISWSLKKLSEKGKLKESWDGVFSRIGFTTDLAGAAKDADFVIEAVVENTEVKRRVFATLEENTRKDVVLSTNTSTIPIGDIASALKDPSRVVGLHFFNPPTLIRFVEIIKGKDTSEQTLKSTVEFARSIGTEFIIVNKDVPGFVVNRINLRVFTEAVRLVEEGYKPEEVDAPFRYRLGMPMGPLEVIDFSGVDVAYYVLEEVTKRGFNIEIPKLLKDMVESKKFGVKSGSGFYEYKGFYERVHIPKSKAYRVNPLRVLAPAINEACWLIREEVSTRDDIDKAMKLGMNYPRGLLEYADEYGLDNVINILEKRQKDTSSEEYAPDPLLSEMVSSHKLGKKTGEGFYSWKYEKKEFGPVIYEKRHNYAVITMNRPNKLNALNEEMWLSLREAFLTAQEDDDIRAVVITGKGRAFCAGDDIAVMEGWQSFMDGKLFFEKVASPLLETFLNYEKPIISLVNGYAFGGGFEINLFFDVVVASQKALFSLPEGLIGALPPIASTMGVALLGRRLGRYCLTAERLDAYEAKDLGVVDIVVSEDQLELVGAEIAFQMSALSPLSLRAIKRSFRALKEVFKGALDVGLHELVELIPTDDFKEGMRAFVEKRKPKWKGK